MISQADNPKDQQTNGYNMEYSKVAPYSNIKKKITLRKNYKIQQIWIERNVS